MLHNAAAVSIKSMLSATAAKSSWCWFSSHLLWMKFENFIRASCDGFSNALLGCHSSLHRCPMSLGMTLLGKVESVKITCSGKLQLQDGKDSSRIQSTWTKCCVRTSVGRVGWSCYETVCSMSQSRQPYLATPDHRASRSWKACWSMRKFRWWR